MKHTTLALLSLFTLTTVIACGNVPKNRTDGYVPGQLACPTNTDPDCIGGSTAAIQVPLPESGRQSTQATPDGRSIFGLCELFVEGDPKPKPCTSIRLVVRSTRENEERTAVVDGFNFKIEDLGQKDYRLRATSTNYNLETNQNGPLTPGQTLKIRVKAKAR